LCLCRYEDSDVEDVVDEDDESEEEEEDDEEPEEEGMLCGIYFQPLPISSTTAVIYSRCRPWTDGL